MELIVVPVPTDALSGGAYLQVLHSETPLERGLEPDEPVIVLDADGALRAAVVDEVDFTLTDTSYRLSLGVRLPADLAVERLSGSPTSVGRRQVHEVADLLGELRGRSPDDLLDGRVSVG